jgi:hypothetical protein
MKTSLLAFSLLALLVLGAREYGRRHMALLHDPYWDEVQYQQYLLATIRSVL